MSGCMQGKQENTKLAKEGNVDGLVFLQTAPSP